MKKSHVIPLILALLSILGCLGFARHYLHVSSARFARDFERENFNELSSEDTYALTTRLNALSETIPWICIVGKREERIFFEKRSGDCTTGLGRERVAISLGPTSDIAVEFTLGLASELGDALLVFLILQVILLITLILSTRASERSRLNAVTQLGTLAAQVAHDIRSPLAALAMAERDLNSLPEETRILVRSAFGRIQDIANQLLEENRALSFKRSKGLKVKYFTENHENAPNRDSEAPSVQLLSSVISSMITEKRLQYRSKLGIEIESQISSEGHRFFAHIQLNVFKRVLSNLINNAVEAVADHGKIRVCMHGVGSQIELRIEDNGKGIPTEILAKLGTHGETYGKTGGSGLGLYHARTSIESWGGKLEIRSEIGGGTAVILTLPRAAAPTWFVEELRPEANSVLVILDDDESIHRIWRGRSDSARLADYEIRLVHLSTPMELRAWKGEAKMRGTVAKYLLDYELLGFKETGLDLVEELGIATQSILVTSRYEEPGVRERCLRLNVPLIPKGMAGFVPIRVVESKHSSAGEEKAGVAADNPAAILIDDDHLVHMMWNASAKQAGLRLAGFKTAKDFFTAAESLNRSVPVYVDFFLGKDEQESDVRGEDISRIISEMGFQRIYLATGLASVDIEKLTWLTGVRGKEPPFSEPDFRGG